MKYVSKIKIDVNGLPILNTMPETQAIIQEITGHKTEMSFMANQNVTVSLDVQTKEYTRFQNFLIKHFFKSYAENM